VSVHELLDVVFRWAHLIAGIMWIGNSMLFNWLDRNLVQRSGDHRLSQGRIWMVHSGAFYEVEKKLLEPGTLPASLHWFRWQNLATWLTGISLLVLVYYLNDATFLVDPTVRALTPEVAIALSAGSLLIGWLAYDLLWNALGARPGVATALSFVLLFGAAWAFSELFSGRGAYLQTGVLIGTVMTGNVWMRVLPSQHQLIAATREGHEQDARLSLRAKQRSIHNNYLTFPLLFIMVSSHFPSAYGHHLNWLVLIVVMAGGAGVRHFMNVRYHGRAWLVPGLVTGALALGGVMVLTRVDRPQVPAVDYEVGFARAQEIVLTRCLSCHSQNPQDDVFRVPQAGVLFDTAEQILSKVDRILERTIRLQDMPFQNKTGMTMEERGELARWIERGARRE
jgi:uncharacterized membrane protein